MKTAEDWADEIRYGYNIGGIDAVIKQIQIDAMREGMRRATDKMMTTIVPQHSMELLKERKQAILSAAENLTEKDLL